MTGCVNLPDGHFRSTKRSAPATKANYRNQGIARLLQSFGRIYCDASRPTCARQPRKAAGDTPMRRVRPLIHFGPRLVARLGGPVEEIRPGDASVRGRREALAQSHAHYGDDADRIQAALNRTAATPPGTTS